MFARGSTTCEPVLRSGLTAKDAAHRSLFEERDTSLHKKKCILTRSACRIAAFREIQRLCGVSHDIHIRAVIASVVL